MIASAVIRPQEGARARQPVSSTAWLLLIHQLPPKPDYLRVKVRRRLQRIGAVALKSTVYVLPAHDEAREDFQWLQREILADGGEAVLCEATMLAGTSDDALVEQLSAERNADYHTIAEEARQAGERSDLARLKRRLEDTMSIDYFDAAGRSDAERELDALTTRLSDESGTSGGRGGGGRPRNATWVTRQGVKVDRIGSAWLIRRFIDPGARFRFVPAADARGYRLAPGELRFDMYNGEYGHEGDRCTFETLLAQFPPTDRGAVRALRAIAEIVHDIDLKEAKFDRAETAGVAAMIAGIVAASDDDARRLERGTALFDDLFASFGPRT